MIEEAVREFNRLVKNGVIRIGFEVEEKHNSLFDLIKEKRIVIKNYRDKNINKIDVLTHKQIQPYYQKFNKALSRSKAR